MTRRTLIALASAAALAAGCGGGDGSDGAQDADSNGQPTTVERTTRVEVLKNAGKAGGFDPEAVFRRDGPGVVTIVSIFKGEDSAVLGGDGEGEEPQGGVGSGFVVGDEGEIATNAHVVSQGEGREIKKASEVYVKFADDNQVKAKIVGLDPNADVALLKLSTLDGLTLRPLALGASTKVRVGEPVAAIGSPFGEEQSLSVGVVSATDRAIDSLTGFETLGAVQTDAAINQGNSGGPLLNSGGQVIGINAQIRTNSGGGEGVGYAIPIDQIKRSLDQLREDGEVRYPYLGVSTSPVYPQLAKKFDLGTENGAWVQQVVGDGPAQDAGIKAGKGEERFQARPYSPGGDVITKVEDTRIETANDVGQSLTPYKPGDTVTLEIVRDGKKRTIDVKLGERPAQIDRRVMRAAQALDLARSLREVVLPMLGAHAAREHEAEKAVGGDVTFAIDARAEEHLGAWVAEHVPEVAVYSEDQGLVGPSDPEQVLVVDPVDGTRPALAGFESACVSVALARMGDGPLGPTMADVEVGAIVELKSGHAFLAERGRGLEADVPVRLSANEDLERMFWVYGLRGRPARVLIEVLAELLDTSSTGGGVFDLGSATYDMTRIVTGQLDAYVEPSPRIVDEVPGMREAYERVGGGAVLNNTPYDLAAAVLVLQEAGAVVTGARGEPLDDRPLLGSGVEHQMSCIAAANEALHRRVLGEVESGIGRLSARPH